MRRKNYLKYILTITIIILLNISNKVYSQNIDKLYEKIDLFRSEERRGRERV